MVEEQNSRQLRQRTVSYDLNTDIYDKTVKSLSDKPKNILSKLVEDILSSGCKLAYCPRSKGLLPLSMLIKGSEEPLREAINLLENSELPYELKFSYHEWGE